MAQYAWPLVKIKQFSPDILLWFAAARSLGGMGGSGDRLLRLLLEWDNDVQDEDEMKTLFARGLSSRVRDTPALFGDLLRQLRWRREASLKEAANLLGISFSNLGRIERGERSQPPSPEFIDLLESTYAPEIDRELRSVGYVLDGDNVIRAPHHGPGTREQFERLVLCEELRSGLWDRSSMDWFSERTMLAVLELASKLEAHLKTAGALTVEELLERPLPEPRTTRPGSDDG